MRPVVILVSASLLLAGCAPSAPQSAVNESAADAIGLINMWRVADARGTGPESWLRLDGSDWMAWVDCGVVGGAWEASGGLLVASVDMSMGPDGSCLPNAGVYDPSLDWLINTTSFRISGDGYELLDAEGAVMAKLAVDGTPPTSEYFIDSYTEAPEVTDAIRAQFVEPAALPEGVDLATDILGRWEPDEIGEGEHPFVDFSADGTWRGSDGCNGMGGRWAQGGDGLFLGTGGISTQIGCLNSPAPGWVAAASRVGLRDGALTFFNSSGAVIGEVHRT